MLADGPWSMLRGPSDVYGLHARLLGDEVGGQAMRRRGAKVAVDEVMDECIATPQARRA